MMLVLKRAAGSWGWREWRFLVEQTLRRRRTWRKFICVAASFFITFTSYFRSFVLSCRVGISRTHFLLLNDVTCLAKLWTVVYYFKPQYESILCWMDSGTSSIKRLSIQTRSKVWGIEVSYSTELRLFCPRLVWRLRKMHQFGLPFAKTPFWDMSKANR